MDKEIIEKRLQHIQDRLSDIQEGITPLEASSEQWDKKLYFSALIRWCEEIIESAVSVNQLLLEDRGIVPDSYYNSFTELSRLGLFCEDIRKRLASTAGFRNRIAHDYLDLDETITLASIKMMLKHYPRYVR